jgi:hypothetical protein
MKIFSKIPKPEFLLLFYFSLQSSLSPLDPPNLFLFFPKNQSMPELSIKL